MTDPANLPEILEIPLPGDVKLQLRLIPAGSFRMGSRGEYGVEEPAHLVEIPQDFYLGTFPVTQEQYRAIAPLADQPLEPSHFKNLENSPRRPVEHVSWDDAMAVCRKLSTEEWFTAALTENGLDLKEDWQAGLPSEAMWEYACCAGSETQYWNGDGEAALAEIGWFYDNSGNETHPVGEMDRPNPWGLHDMHGNVWEWCADVWDSKAYRTCLDGSIATVASNAPRKPKDDRFRVLRGGSWGDTAGDCRSAYRLRFGPVDRYWVDGFRLCVFPGSGDATSQGPEAKPGAESAAAAVEPRDEAEQAQAEDGAMALDLSKAKLPAAKRPRKNPKK